MSDQVEAKPEANWEALLEYLTPKLPLYCPHADTITPKQKVFLFSKALEVMFGGHAGGGKSDALLMAALQYVDVPGYAAIIFRNTYQDLALPGSLLDRAHDWFDDQPEIVYRTGTHTFRFPSDATITFGYLDRPNDHLRYKGAEFQYCGFDEVTEIREKHYRYLFSRLRRPSGTAGLALSKVPLRMRSATNPAPNWVRRRFIEEGEKNNRLYIPSSLSDNPFVDADSYREATAQLDEVERARLERGDWYAEEEGAKFKRNYFKIIGPDEVPELAFMNVCRYWDLAASVPTEANPDPDWTAGAKIALHDGRIYILDMRRDRLDPGGVEELVWQTAAEDGVAVKIRMEQEGGASGKNTIDHYARHVLVGFDFDGHPAVKNKDDRANTWAGKAKRGEVLIVRGDWVTPFLDEVTVFGSSTAVHDDQVDAVSGAFEILAGLGTKQKGKFEIIV